VRLVQFIALVCCWLWSCWIETSWAATVVIVAPDHRAAYGEVGEALIEQLQHAGVSRQDVLRLGAQEFAATAEAELASPKLWVGLGTEGLTQILAKGPRAPVLAAMVPRSGYERVLRDSAKKRAVSVSAIYLDQPFSRQLDLLRIALPDARRVGVLWGPESAQQQPALVAAMRARSMELTSGASVGGESVFSGLRGALDNVDVFLAVADPQVFNGSTLPNILLATYRARIPVLAFSPAYVKAGALLSLHTTSVQVGSQAGAVARLVMQGAALPPSQYPMDFSVSVNDYVARSLGLSLDASVLTERLRYLEKRP